jgi:hypothetical protein
MKTLYELSNEFQSINEILDGLGGELPTKEIDDYLTNWMSTLASAEASKLDGYISLIRQNEMEENQAKIEMEFWKQRMTVRKNKIEFLKIRLKQHLERTGRVEIKTESGRVICLQNNGGSLPLHISEDLDPKRIPEEFTYTETKIDRTKIADALKAGRELSFAAFGRHGTSLRIK